MNLKFLDIGCKTGASFHIAEKFGYNINEGLGVDINKKHVKNSQEKGLNVIFGDITKGLNFEDGAFELVIANHVMEHLPNKGLFLLSLDEILRLSSKYVYISFPIFDHDKYLNSLGLKTFYSDWTGHTCMFYLYDLLEVLKDYEKDLKFIKPIIDSNASEIHPISSPKDQLDYDSKIHPPKPFIKFDDKIYREFQLIIKK